MNGPVRITVLAIALAGLTLSVSGCNKLAARDQLNKGVESYKAAKYEEAIGHFQKATELDPNLPHTYHSRAMLRFYDGRPERLLHLDFPP